MADLPELLDVREATDGPEERVMDQLGRGRMSELVDRLPERQREVLVLRAVVGLSIEEIADIVDCTVGAVRIAQHRALAKMRVFFGERDAPERLGWSADNDLPSGAILTGVER